MIEQMLMNLAINARDAMPDGGQLTLHSHILLDSKSASALELSPGTYILYRLRHRVWYPRELLPRYLILFHTKESAREWTVDYPWYMACQTHCGTISVKVTCSGTTFSIYLQPMKQLNRAESQ